MMIYTSIVELFIFVGPPSCGRDRIVDGFTTTYAISAYYYDLQKSIPLKMILSCLRAHDNVKWAVPGH